MTQKVNEQYYEAGAGLLYGLLVDAALSEKLQEVLDKAHDEIQNLIKKNMEHVVIASSATAYPRGKHTDFKYIEAKPSLGVSYYLEVFDKAFNMKKVDYVFKTDEDWSGHDKMKAYAQKAIEEELDAKEKEAGHE